jgi:RNA recognition motif-containing protein
MGLINLLLVFLLLHVKSVRFTNSRFNETQQQCGKVSHWRRVADPVSGKLKGFGFCDYESPEGVLRALRILNGYKLETSELLVRFIQFSSRFRPTVHENHSKLRINELVLQQECVLIQL